MEEISTHKVSEDLEETDINYHAEFETDDLLKLSTYWYCDEDSSKYIEKFDGYSRNNTGMFTVYLDHRMDHSIENAVSMRKLPESCIEFVKDMIKEIQKYPIPVESSNSSQVERLEAHLLLVECPVCKKVSVAPKIPPMSLDNIRKSQVDLIKKSIKGVEEKYDFIRKRLDYMFFIGAGIILLLSLVLVSLWLLFLNNGF